MWSVNEKRLYIYGCGLAGKNIAKVLRNAGCTVVAFVDKRAEKMQNEQENVYTIEWLYEKEFKNADSCAIIITIKNVFDHSSLAKDFLKHGFQHIIFKSSSIMDGFENNSLKTIDNAYEMLMTHLKMPQNLIENFSGEKLILRDRGIIKILKNMYLALFPVELLFGNIPNGESELQSNFVAEHPLTDLYVTLMDNKEGSILKMQEFVKKYAEKSAIRYVDIEETWYLMQIDGRISVYNNMEDKLSLDPSFFRNNATKVIIRNGGGFSLVKSGKNRVAYMIAKGLKYVPILVSAEDWDEYVNIEVVQELTQLIDESKNELFAPIPHPYFYNFPCKARNFMKEGFWNIARIIQHFVELTTCNIKIFLNDEGYLSRLFVMLGCQVERKIHKNITVCEMLDKLFYIKDIKNEQVDKPHVIIWSDEFDAIELKKSISNRTKIIIIFTNYESRINVELELFLMKEGFNSKQIFVETMWSQQYIIGYKYYKAN